MEQVVRKSKPRNCPNCCSHKIARILYGLIDELTPDLQRDLEEGKVRLGGCVIGEAKWECVDCGTKLYKDGRGMSSV
jgi:hypothetical protein